MSLTAAQTATQMADTVRNPVIDAKAGGIVTVTLKMNGVAFDPNALYAALDTLYGTVTLENDASGRRAYNFRVSA